MGDNPFVSLFDISTNGKHIGKSVFANLTENKPPQHGVSKEKFLRDFKKDCWGVNLVVGKSGSGKTALCTRLSEFVNRITYSINMLKTPKWITPLQRIRISEDDFGNFQECIFVFQNGIETPAEKGCTVIVDDAGNILESNQMYNTPNETMKKLTFIARHLNICFFVNIQDTSSLNKQVVGQSRAIFFKEPALLQFGTERDFIGKMIEDEVRPFFELVPKEQRKFYTYVFSSDFKGVIKTGLAKGWTKEISQNKG